MKSVATLSVLASASVVDKFEEFQTTFQKVYATAEEKMERFAVFAENMEKLAAMKAMDPDATYSHLSPLADWSEEEFTARNSLKVTKDEISRHAMKARSDRVKMSFGDLPSSFDWTQKGAVNDVKDQAQCGSCWAFSTVANIEGQNYIQNGNLISLSEQELVDCDDTDNGCNGGLPSNAMKELIDSKTGLELESDYGYKAEDSKCVADQSKEIVYLSKWVAISTDETQIAHALMSYGPLSIGINASYMQLYTGGISDPWFCNPQALDHGVAIVAFGEEKGKQFWTIRNSWGPGWGENGYYRIVRGKGKCGMNQMVTSSIVAKQNNMMYL